MEDFEKLGVFYIGREYDLVNKKSGEHLILYDSKDMVTHGVCVGMTGSGKPVLPHLGLFGGKVLWRKALAAGVVLIDPG